MPNDSSQLIRGNVSTVRVVLKRWRPALLGTSQLPTCYAGAQMIRGFMDTEKLQTLYSTDRTAQVFFDLMAKRQRNQNETKVDRILNVLKSEGNPVSRGEIVNLFKALQSIGLGQFVTGRRGWPSRFVWSVQLTEAATAAIGEEAEEVERLDAVVDEEGEADDSHDGDSLTHEYNLRADLSVQFDLPIDLTEKEAQRLAAFISSLPMEEYD